MLIHKPIPTPTADEIKTLIKQLGLSQASAAKLCQVDTRTLERWCAGTSRMNAVHWLGFKTICIGILQDRQRIDNQKTA